MGIIYDSNVRILLLEYEELNDSKKTSPTNECSLYVFTKVRMKLV